MFSTNQANHIIYIFFVLFFSGVLIPAQQRAAAFAGAFLGHRPLRTAPCRAPGASGREEVARMSGAGASCNGSKSGGKGQLGPPRCPF